MNVIEDTARLRWGIIGPGRIADHFSAAINRCESGRLVAVGTRDPSRDDFGDRFPNARIHDGYDALLGDEEVDVVYIATPHPFHAEWAIKAASAGKHVLCEKPIGLSYGEACAIFEAASRAGTFMGEAFMYRFHPLTARLLAIVRSRCIGDPVFIESSFGFAVPRDAPNRRLFAPELAGGGIYDLGVYPVSMARLIAGAATGEEFLDPVETKGVAHLGDTGVDEWAAAILRFPGGLIAQISCAISLQLDNMLRIYGSGGSLEVSEFWFGGGFHGGTAYVHVCPIDSERYSIAIPDDGRGVYDFEVEATARAISAGQQQFGTPGMSWNDTLGNMRVVDEWHSDIEAGVQEEPS